MQYLFTEEEYARLQIDKAAIRREVKAELKSKLKEHQLKAAQAVSNSLLRCGISLRREESAAREIQAALQGIADIDWMDETPKENKPPKDPPTVGASQEYSDSLRRLEHSQHFNKP